MYSQDLESIRSRTYKVWHALPCIAVRAEHLQAAIAHVTRAMRASARHAAARAGSSHSHHPLRCACTHHAALQTALQTARSFRGT